MRPSIARARKQLDHVHLETYMVGPAVQHAALQNDIPPPQSTTLGLHPVSRELPLISSSAEGMRLSWPEHTVA